MPINIEDVFNKIQNTKVSNSPFQHLVVDNLLPDHFFKKLSTELEENNFSSNFIRAPYGNKERFGVDITDYPTWKASGHRIKTKLHELNYKSLVSNQNTITESFIKLLLQNEKEFYSLLSSKLPTERLHDDYFFHINMTKDAVGYEIEPHPDDKQNIFTILFYAPQTDINREHGLHIYKDVDDKPSMSKKIELVPNRMIIFAPSRPNEKRPATWHEVKRLPTNLVGTRNSFQMFFYKNNS